MRCVPVAEHLSLAIISLGRASDTLELALTECLLEIAGASQVHVDAARGTIQALYDGDQATAEGVHRFLAAAGREDCGAQPTRRSDPWQG